MAEEYPPQSFNFKVEFDIDGVTYNSSSFQEVSGLTAELEPIAYREGGENRLTHKLPGAIKYSNVVLKRGLITDRKILDWCRDMGFSNQNQTCDMKIILNNEYGKAVMTWKLNKAYLAKFEIDRIEEDKSGIAVEKMEFVVESFERLD